MMCRGPAAMQREREFLLTDQDYQRISALVREHTGISLSAAKRDMVYSRLSRRLRRLGINDFAAYCDFLLHDESGQEFTEFTNAITTNLTSFFREGHHFEYLQNALLPELMRARGDQRRLRIWSAGCSTGEEPYSIAMVLAETLPPDWDAKILATDLDSNVLTTASNGIYEETRLQNVPQPRLRRWFLRGRGSHAGQFRVSPALQSIITFKRLNLMDAWPMRGPFDIVFCRNVVIYFDKPTQQTLMERYADMLCARGHLFLGHSETLYRVTDRFELLGHTIYRKRT